MTQNKPIPSFWFLGSLLPSLPYRQDMEQQLGSLILATDISRQNEFLLTFREHLDHRDLDLQLSSHRHFILQVLRIGSSPLRRPSAPVLPHSSRDHRCLPTDRPEVCGRL